MSSFKIVAADILKHFLCIFLRIKASLTLHVNDLLINKTIHVKCNWLLEDFIKGEYLIILGSISPWKLMLWVLITIFLEALLMSTHIISFSREIIKISQNYHQILLNNYFASLIYMALKWLQTIYCLYFRGHSWCLDMPSVWYVYY